MSRDVIPFVSLLIAVSAVCLTLWQNVLQRRAAQTQVFLHMLDQFKSDEVFKGSVSLIGVASYDNLEAFDASVTQETQEQIYYLVDFLNDLARLVWSGYLPRETVWDLYFMQYRIAHEKLIPWWLEGQRQRSYKQKFIAFEEMCLQVAGVTQQQMDAYDAKQYPNYDRGQRRLSTKGAST
jgi:hypothetical protein